ncbi:hypothetical protein [Burkholderia seminalis]|uniref:hypothetical protein n=1 Tax=Burkholderia seminalis TaxID=488731 RepID=UPI0031E0D909
MSNLFAHKIALVPLAGPMIRQTIGLSFLHRHERDPNQLATVCRRLAVKGPTAR